MAAARAPNWGSLPTDLLLAVFSAVGPPSPWLQPRLPETVLSFEERMRAESVCTHWRQALASGPGSYSRLRLVWPHRPSPVEAAAAAVARARALAARAPAVQHIQLWATDSAPASEEMREAFASALHVLLGRPGGGRSLELVLGHKAGSSLLLYLAAASAYTSLERLEINGEGDVHLQPRQGQLASLPHLLELEIHAAPDAAVTLRLPMPRLQQLKLTIDRGWDVAPLPAYSFTIDQHTTGVRPFSGLDSYTPLLPALRRIHAETQGFHFYAAEAPALAELSLTLYSPAARLNMIRPPGMPSSLTSLDLRADSVITDDVLSEMEEEEAAAADTSLYTNRFAPLLEQRALSLRSLAIDVAEPPDAAMAAALRSLSRLTRLALGTPGPDCRMGLWGPPSLDCQLLGGMAALRELQVDGRCSLAFPASLSSLGALRTLRLDNAASMPAVAAHLPHLSALELPQTSATELVAHCPALAHALASLPALARLSLRGERLRRGASRPAIEGALAFQALALQALAIHVPQGCAVEAPPAAIGGR